MNKELRVYKIVLIGVYFMLAVLLIIALSSCSNKEQPKTAIIDKSTIISMTNTSATYYHKLDSIIVFGDFIDKGSYYQVNNATFLNITEMHNRIESIHNKYLNKY